MIDNSFRRLAELAALMAFVSLASCEKRTGISNPERTPDGGMVQIQMSASIEIEGDGGVKTSISEEKTDGKRLVTWNEGDEIKVFWSAEGYCASKAETDGESTSFTLEVPKGTNHVWAVYPSTTETLLSDGKLSVEIPSLQNGNFADHNISVAEADLSTGNMKFYNVSSCLRLTVTDPQITKAVVWGNNGEPVSGKISVDINSDGIDVGTASETSDCIEVGLGGRSVYYISILPGINFSQGISVELFKGEESVGVVSTGSFALTRAQIANVGNLDWLTNRYVTVNGRGRKDGTSWEDAWSIAELKAFLTATDGRTDEERMKFNDLSFRLAEGTYVFNESDIVNVEYSAPISYTLYGGFPSEGGLERSGKTVFSGENSHGILAVKNNAYICFDGISFSNGRGNGGGQAAVRIEGANADVSFNGCIFSNNTNSATAAAVQVSGKANANFTDCEFSNNSTTYAAALNVDKSSCTAKNCTFKDNVLSNNAAVQIKGSGIFENCTFANNSATSGVGAAMIIFPSGSSRTSVQLNNCTFSANRSKSGGAIFISGALTDVTVDGGSFENNEASLEGGAIVLHSTGSDSNVRASLLVKNAGFTGNKANNGGGAIRLIQEGNTSDAGYADLAIEDCTFNQNCSAIGYGGALDLRNSGSTIVKGCTLEGNYTDVVASYAKGGAINCCAGNAAGGSIEITSCVFKGNYTKGGAAYSLDKGGAVNVGGNGNDNNNSFVAYINDCAFAGNHATQGGALNVAKGTMCMNACSFTGNYITFRYGTTLLADAGSKLRMNNISIANDTYSTSADQKHQAAWFNIGTADLLLSNATLIGENKSGTAFAGGNPMLIRFDGVTSGTANFINDIIAFPDIVRVPIQATANFNINVIDCKTGDFNASDLTIFTGTSAKDFVGNSDYFSGLQAVNPTETEKHFYWSWYGTLLKSTNTSKAQLSDVNTAIKAVDADFYTWLQSVGGTTEDALGNGRGNETWPGAYQKN